MGKTEAGKSTYLNNILGSIIFYEGKTLRAKISKALIIKRK